MRWSRVRLRTHLRPGLLLALIAVAEYASPWRTAGRAVTLVVATILTVGFVRASLRHLHLARRVRAVVRGRLLELALSAAALALLASKAVVLSREFLEPEAAPGLEAAYRQYAAGFLIVAGLRLVAGDLSIRRVTYRLDLRPAQTVARGFAGAILAGTLLLSLPASVARLEDLSLLDALFTAVSAVTVTGLIVYDPGSFHTGFGQGVLLVLIQLGGLGTMVASASLVVLAGRRLLLRQAVAVQETLDLQTVGQVRADLRAIVGLTCVAEGVGAVLLWALWAGNPAVETPWFAALFHAVSAFCNAGFSTFATGLLPFRDDPATCAVIAALIVLGGLGFPLLRSVGRWMAAARSARRVPGLSLHARLTLLASAVLLLAGFVGALGLEWRNALEPLSWPGRVSNAGFLSVTARTAGFATVPIDLLAPATLWLVMVLMFVGGSPGSTAGGIKTTTAAIIVSALWATLRGRPRVEAFRRTIPDEQVAKALALVGVSGAVLAAAVLTLLATQSGGALPLTFEAVAAFGTVGLSTGLTPTLDTWGRVVLLVLMFVGRTGPLTLGFALAARTTRSSVVYPTEKVMIG